MHRPSSSPVEKFGASGKYMCSSGVVPLGSLLAQALFCPESAHFFPPALLLFVRLFSFLATRWYGVGEPLTDDIFRRFFF